MGCKPLEGVNLSHGGFWDSQVSKGRGKKGSATKACSRKLPKHVGPVQFGDFTSAGGKGERGKNYTSFSTVSGFSP